MGVIAEKVSFQSYFLDLLVVVGRGINSLLVVNAFRKVLLHLQGTLTIKLKATMKNTSPAAQLLNWCGHRIIIFARRKDSKTNNFIVFFFFLVGT